MFKDFEVQSYRGEYQVKFIPHESALKDTVRQGDVILLDSNIKRLYPNISSIVKNNLVIEIEAHETAKEYRNIGNIIDKLIASGFSKNNRIIAIGGGITQDISAFTSSILFRGVDWIFYPTNLLTQCDSCIGSKTSVNFGEYKNQLGGFYPPKSIFIDFDFINTLSSREICSGLGEMMHYFLVDGEIELSALRSSIVKAKTDRDELALLIEKSLKIKKAMIEIDEFDQGPRNVFNYGHSFGHAIEATTDFAIPHGIAVAYGMDLANLISTEIGNIKMELRNEIREILNVIWNETPLPAIDLDAYMRALSKDKKNIGNEIKVILVRQVGDMYKTTLEKNDAINELIARFFNDKLYEVPQ